MKISNETKVGALSAIAIALLILGFNFLKEKACLNPAILFMLNMPIQKG